MKRSRILKNRASLLGLVLICLLLATPVAFARDFEYVPREVQSDDPTPPSDPVKLIFVHHSTGGNWLADPNNEQPYGGLGMVLRDNNYFVSATNYGWGPDSIGDRTDIPNWPEWFVGPNSDVYVDALYNESGQNIGDFGAWSRLGSDPGGENEIIMFKSCFPNSDLYGAPDDPPASEPNDQYTVGNAKAVYNALLTYFETRQDKLFIVITAPPMAQGEYASDAQSGAERAANARAFTGWLVNEWLAEYPYNNVAVFDYYNVLTSNGTANRLDDADANEEPNDEGQDDGNHHRWWDGAIQHLQTVDNDFSAYPTDSSWDSHPTTAGHQKATAEFVPLLNIYYNRWKSGAPVSRPTPTAPPEPEDATPTSEPESEPTPTSEPETETQPPAAATGVIDDLEVLGDWYASADESGSTIVADLDQQTVHGGAASLRIEYSIVEGGWGDCGRSFESPQDWSGEDALSLWLSSDGGGKPVSLLVLTGEAATPYSVHFETTEASVGDWDELIFPWAEFAPASWADEGVPAEPDLAQVVALGFNFGPSEGVLFVDDIALASGDFQTPVEPSPTPEPEEPEPTEEGVSDDESSADQPAEDEPEADEPTTEEDVPEEPATEEEPKGGLCPAALAVPLATLGVAWGGKRRREGGR